MRLMRLALWLGGELPKSLTGINGVARLYLIALYSVGVVLSPAVEALVAALGLLLLAYSSLRRFGATMDVGINFALIALIAVVAGGFLTNIWAIILVMLPALVLLDNSFRKHTRWPEGIGTSGRRPTPTLVAMVTGLIIIFGVSAFTLNLNLAVTGMVLSMYLLLILVWVLWKIPQRFLATQPIRMNVVAGDTRSTTLEFRNLTGFDLSVVFTPSTPWCRTNLVRTFFPAGGDLSIRIGVTPPLSGPTIVSISVVALDPWGLIGTCCSVDVLELYIIPRARVAEWRARRFLEGAGSAENSFAIADQGQHFSIGNGLDYFGSRGYRPGDRMRDIDWKATAKHRELIVKELGGPSGQGGLMIVNMEAADEEEADRLVSTLIMVAVALAEAGSQVSIAAYTETEVCDVIPGVGPAEVVVQALYLGGKVTYCSPTLRFLDPPDPIWLRSRVLQSSRDGVGRTIHSLHQLLDLEYRVLQGLEEAHGLPGAIRTLVSQLSPPGTVFRISRNRNEEKVLVSTLASLRKQGYIVADIPVGE